MYFKNNIILVKQGTVKKNFFAGTYIAVLSYISIQDMVFYVGRENYCQCPSAIHFQNIVCCFYLISVYLFFIFSDTFITTIEICIGMNIVIYGNYKIFLNYKMLWGFHPVQQESPSLNSILLAEMLGIGQMMISWCVSLLAHTGTSPPPFG